MHLDEKEDLDLVNSCSIYSLEPLMLMDGRTLARISIEMAINGDCQHSFVGRAGGKGIGFWVCIIELKNQWM
jgi:hypothetical protein